jgi:hypothetical protein
MRRHLSLSRALQRVCLAALVGLAGCAAVEPPRAAYDEAGLIYDANDLRANAKRIEIEPSPPHSDELVCREEVAVGSHRVKNRCFTREQAARIRRESQLWLRTGGMQGGGMVAR